MKWHEISKVAKIVNLSRQAVYKRLKKLSIEERISLGENLVEDGQKILLSDDGIKRLFDMTTADNLVDTPVVEKLSVPVNPVNHEVVEGLQNQLSAKEKEVVRMGDILDKVMGQLEEERRLRGEERQRTDTILMKLTTDISTLQKCLEYKKPEFQQDTSMSGISINTKKEEPPRRSAPTLQKTERLNRPSQVSEISLWESFQIIFNDVNGFLFGRG